ncbi:MAG: SUMF1/EgtB/PvdO family nonheme iron enzyme [Colwellia sp.]|nr:SUMF1/EgtB/PvdO family nonheme iron enzyme [Colwellia sp.]
MFNKKFCYSSSILKALLLSMSAVSTVWAQDHIVPPMINIPAGNFMMGAEGGDPANKPIHAESVAAFQMGKYAVTVAEFRIFAEETGFNPESTCGDFMDSNGLGGPTDLGTGRWDKHRYSYSEYQPVTCINWQDANNYADWLSKKTGIQYRLPTEPEWEYAAKANTTSRYFWGNDLDMTQACLYGNFADQTGEYVNNETYGLSNIGWIEHGNCDDGEAYIAIVGLYRANPFGLYDIAGNASELLNSCYYEDGYKERSEEEMDVNKCEYTSHRGSGWHYPAQPHSSRLRYKREGWNRLSDTAFRLATDVNSNKLDASTVKFEEELKQAQTKRLATRPKIPAAPINAQLVKLKERIKNNTYQLSWQPNRDKRVTGYDIYQTNSPYAHLYGGYYQNHYKKINSVNANVNSLEVNLPNHEGSIRLVTKTKKLNSLPSQPVNVFVKPKTVFIPGKVFMNDTTKLENVHLRKSTKENNPAPFYLSKVNKNSDNSLVTTTFNINVEKSAWYNVNYRGGSFIKGVFFKLWQNDTLLGEISYDPELKYKTSNLHKVFLEKGSHSLQLSVLREGFDMWNLTWLEFTEVKS